MSVITQGQVMTTQDIGGLVETRQNHSVTFLVDLMLLEVVHAH